MRFDVEIAVVEYLGWFNHSRPHQALGDLPPAEFEAPRPRRPRRSHPQS
jgi:transposase InsO family protein